MNKLKYWTCHWYVLKLNSASIYCWVLKPEVWHILRLTAMLDGPTWTSNAIDFYYRMYSFRFEANVLRFWGKSFLKIRSYVDSLLKWSHSTWPPLSRYDVFPASVLFGFCITMHYPLIHIISMRTNIRLVLQLYRAHSVTSARRSDPQFFRQVWTSTRFERCIPIKLLSPINHWDYRG